MELKIDLRHIVALGCSESIILAFIKYCFDNYPLDIVRNYKNKRFVKCSKSKLSKELNMSRFQVNTFIKNLIEKEFIEVVYAGDKKSMHVSLNNQKIHELTCLDHEKEQRF